MEDNKKIIQDQLARSILEKGSVKCPSCESLVLWEDSEQYNPDGSKDRYFWCSSEECDLHQKDVVKVSISKGFLQTVQQNFSKIGQGFIAAAFGALSMWGYAFMNKAEPPKPDTEITKKLEDKEIQLKEEKTKNETLNNSISDLQKQINDLKKGTPISSTDSNINSNQRTLDSLENVIRDKDGIIRDLKSKAGNSAALSPEQMADLGMFYASDKKRKSKEATDYLFGAINHPEASFEDKEKEEIVKGLIELRTNLEIDKYEPLLKLIDKHMPRNAKDLQKARVYWFYADAHDNFSEEYRINKRNSLKHYLMASSKYNLSPQDVKDGATLFTHLKNIPPANYNSEIPIKQAFEEQNVEGFITGNKKIIRSFLEYATKEGSEVF